MELYITRTKRGVLTLHYETPTYLEGCGWDKVCAILNGNEFPEVTFENSPQKVKIELIKN